MCRIDAGIVSRANQRTIENRYRREGVTSSNEIVVSLEYMGTTYSQTISREKLNEAFGRSYAKIVRGGTQI